VAAEPWERAPVWVHGDLHPANTLFVDGRLAAVIDFGDLCAGDPATDLAAGWLLLPPAMLPAFEAAYGGLDGHLRRRSLGWALLFALMLVAIGAEGRPTYGSVGRAALATVLGTGRDEV
jgi:aminoglycoside phosphotransferase (APT) family kinase protein